MHITYYYSACVGLVSEDVSILCDPWFTEGAYDGAWYHYPPVEDPFTLVGKHDWIYVSHAHPDHYDPAFIKQYLARYPETRVLIADFIKNFLGRRMALDGIEYHAKDDIEFGQARVPGYPSTHRRGGPTKVGLFENENGLDSAIVMQHGSESIVNMNDCPIDHSQLDAIKDFVGRPDIALLAHTGAGPYPQTYFEPGGRLRAAVADHKERFHAEYREMREALNPVLVVPFAGQYVLGGRLAHLNEHRAVTDAVEVYKFDTHAVVLKPGASLDTETLTFGATRTEPFDPDEMSRYVQGLASLPMDYELAFSGLDPSKVPWESLLSAAYTKALTRLKNDKDWWICIKLPSRWFCMYLSREGPITTTIRDPQPLPRRSEIFIDPRYLFGLLTHYYNWNSAEIGSQYTTRRYPDEFDREVQEFLIHFHI